VESIPAPPRPLSRALRTPVGAEMVAAGSRTSNVHSERATLKDSAIHEADRFLGVGGGLHLDEREASGLASIAIGDERDRRNGTGFGEELANLLLSR